jgi:polar amino acid transport system substrate-binding protein
MKDAQCIFLKRHTAARINLRHLVLASVIFCLILPRLTAGQPLTIISDPYPPLGYVKDGKIVGFTVDVIKLLLERTGIEGKFEMYPWARAYLKAQKEKDILIYQLSYSKERERLFQLVGPILHESEYLFKLKDRTDVIVKNLADAKQYYVGSVRDYFHHKYLIKNGFEEGKNLEATYSDDMNIKKLVSRRIDLMITSEISFSYRVKNLGYHRDDFEKTLQVVSSDSYLAFSRQTSPNVVSRFAEALDAIKADGSLDRILAEYGVHLPKGQR